LFSPHGSCPRRADAAGLSARAQSAASPATAERAFIARRIEDAANWQGVLDETIEPGRVFDRVTDLDGVPDGYRAMNEREAVKVLIEL
jgi:hypothetical protein